jgi:hypothetical protein
MRIKTVDMVRKIRDKEFNKTKTLSSEDQIKIVKKKSEKLKKELRQLNHKAAHAS